MTLTRKNFLKLTAKGIFVIGTGNSLVSFAPANFKLPPKQQVRLRFALASDGHYGEKGTEYEKFYDEMVGWLNREQAGRGLNFSMINGDLYHDDITFLPSVKNKLDQLKMPYYVSHGNHDHSNAETWEKTWKIPLHHAFEVDDSAFLILNSADETGKYICPDLEWAKEKLKQYAAKKHLFIFMHITPVKWTDNALPCPELVEMFSRQANLKGIFHGHDHDQDGMKEQDGKFYFFDSHIAGSWGTAYRGYRIVEVLADGSVLTYQMNPAETKQVNSNKMS